MATLKPTSPSDADGTSEVAVPARGHLALAKIFSGTLVGWLWKTAPFAPIPLVGLARANVTIADVPSVRHDSKPGDFVLRDYKPQDFETLWRIDQECFGPGIAYSRQELKLYIQRQGATTLLAINKDDAVAGFIVAHKGAVGHIITIDVLSTARRAGVGSFLLTTAENRLQEQGSHAVGLETAVDNLSALAFYKRHGYHVIRTWPRYYPNGVDALVLKKDLTTDSPKSSQA